MGGVKIGGGAPVVVQSMTNTPPQDVAATVKQIDRLRSAGCELVRLAVPDMKAASALKEIKSKVSIARVLDHCGLASKLLERGDELVGFCPFCKKDYHKNCFSANVKKNVFQCFACGAKGNVLDFVMLRERVDVREAGLLLQQWFLGEEKPEPEDAPSRLGIVGRYVLTPETFDVISVTPPGKGNEIQITDALQLLLKQQNLYAFELEGVRHDTGNPLGWLKANVALALKRDDLGPELREYLKKLL